MMLSEPHTPTGLLLRNLIAVPIKRDLGFRVQGLGLRGLIPPNGESNGKEKGREHGK